MRSSYGLFISQHTYVIDLLHRFNLHTLKLVRTPTASSITLSRSDGEWLAEYRSLVGALRYLTMTRLVISFDVHMISQFMHAPRTFQWLAVKRICRYLQGTKDYGMFIRAVNTPCVIVTYSDADWASYLDSRRSTSCYVVFNAFMESK